MVIYTILVIKARQPREISVSIEGLPEEGITCKRCGRNVWKQVWAGFSGEGLAEDTILKVGEAIEQVDQLLLKR